MTTDNLTLAGGDGTQLSVSDLGDYITLKLMAHGYVLRRKCTPRAIADMMHKRTIFVQGGEFKLSSEDYKRLSAYTGIL